MMFVTNQWAFIFYFLDLKGCVGMSLLSVPDDLVHGFRPVTDKRDVAICIILVTEIDVYSLSHFTE